jgi:hypothetical protein
MDLSAIQSAIDAANDANAEATKTASAKTPESSDLEKKAALKKEAETLIGRGRLMAQGFVSELLTQADSLYKQALNEGGNVSGATISEPGSMATETGNKLPTSKNKPPKNDIDETKAVKHVMEESLEPHQSVAVNKAESRINRVSK